MNKLNKPIPCNEKWTNMVPTEGGRICKTCSKTIIDFRNKSWKQIQDLQSSNNNSLCGIYKPKQIKNWGNEIISKPKSMRKVAALALISTAISTSAFSQNTTDSNDFITIYGTISGISFLKDKPEIKTDPIENAIIKVELLNIRTKTDSLGNFSIKIKKNTLQNKTIELVTSTSYYEDKMIEINTSKAENDSINIDQILKPILVPMEPTRTIFYAQPPTILDTIMENLDSLKRKK